jgi:WD40 repeat protein
LKADNKCIIFGIILVGMLIMSSASSATDKRPVFVLQHKAAVNTVSFSPDGSQILTGASDGIARLWNAQTGTEIGHVQDGTRIGCAAFSPDGKRIATGGSGNKVNLWDVKTKRLLLTFNHHTALIQCVAFSPDGKRIASGAGGESIGEDRRLLIWNAESGKVEVTINVQAEGVQAVAFSPDGKRGIIAPASVVPVRIWDAHNGRPVVTLETDREVWGITGAAFSPDGKQIATSNAGRTGSIWDAKTGKELFRLRGHKTWVTSVAYSPDGKRVVTGGAVNDFTLRVWDPRNGRELQGWTAHQDHIHSVAFSSNGKHIVSGGDDNTAKVWDVEATLKGTHNVAIRRQ